MHSTRAIRLACLAAAGVVAPSLAGSQLASRIVVTPYVGAYVPSSNLAQTGLTTGGTTLSADLKHQTAAAAGLTVSYWLNDRFALEGGALYSSSKLKGTLSMTGSPSEDITDYANVWLGSAKLMMQVLPTNSGFNLRLGAGPAIITRSGSSYRGDATGSITGLTDVGGVASLCTRIPINNMASIRLRAEDYIYSAKIGATSTDATGNFNFDSRMQHDFVFSVGLQMFAK